jgi:hypothetical protein
MPSRERRTSPGLDGFAQLNPAHDFPPATAGGILCLRRPGRTPEELIFAPESS